MKVNYYGAKNKAGTQESIDDNVFILEVETEHGVKLTLRENSGGFNIDWDKLK